MTQISRLSKKPDRPLGPEGFSLVEVVVATGISALVLVFTTSLFIDSAKMESGQERQFWLSSTHLEIERIVRSPTGWTAILAANANMACFAAGTDCSAYSTPQPLVLPVEAVVLDGTSATVGMTNKGDFCNTFDGLNGNIACPVGLDLKWTALCDDVNCRHAQPKVAIRFRVKDPGQDIQNLTSFNLVAFKDPKLESLNEVCTAMGGVLAGTTCSIAALNTACDPSNALGIGATYPLGFTNTGSVICGRPSPGTCAASDVGTGFSISGGILCAPACQ